MYFLMSSSFLLSIQADKKIYTSVNFPIFCLRKMYYHSCMINLYAFKLNQLNQLCLGIKKKKCIRFFIHETRRNPIISNKPVIFFCQGMKKLRGKLTRISLCRLWFNRMGDQIEDKQVSQRKYTQQILQQIYFTTLFPIIHIDLDIILYKLNLSENGHFPL